MNVLDWLVLFFRWGSKPSFCIKPFLSQGQWWAQLFKYLIIWIKWLSNIILFRGSMIEPFWSVISTNITLKYYLFWYLCYFWSTNIFGYWFCKYVAFKYIQIFVRYIMWHPNIFGYSFVSILWYSLITAHWGLARFKKYSKYFINSYAH